MINKKYLKSTTETNSSFSKNQPFPYIELKDFFDKNKIKKLTKALMDEEFFQKESDLFKFLQTNDFSASKNPVIKEFRNFITSKKFIEYIEKITGAKLKAGKADMHGTCYLDTDFLLCHDDQLDNRSIALMVYLSNLKEKNGGPLNLYDKKGNAVKRIYPEINKLVLFKVSPTSFHAVEEVIKAKRLTISWWFYDK